MRHALLHITYDEKYPIPEQVDWAHGLRMGDLDVEDAVLVPWVNDHFVTFNEDGWFIEHSFDCRLAGTIGTCKHNQAILNYGDTEQLPHGRWLLSVYEDLDFDLNPAQI